jgi:transcription elongation factor SPT6
VDAEDRLFQDVIGHIVNDYSSEYAELWNQERRDIAQLALKKYLFPAMSKWLKEHLILNAVQYVTGQCQMALMKKLDVAPYTPNTQKYDDDPDENYPDLKVLSLSWGDGSKEQPMLGAMLSPHGELLDQIQLDRIQDMKPETRQEEMDKLANFIVEHRPDVVTISGWTPSTKTRLFDEVNRMILEGNQADRWKRKQIDCIMVDDDIARIYMRSKHSAKEFEGMNLPPLLLYCISIGRKILDPIMEYAALFNSDDDLKLLRLHPLQHLIPEDKFRSAMEQCFINVTNYW